MNKAGGLSVLTRQLIANIFSDDFEISTLKCLHSLFHPSKLTFALSRKNKEEILHIYEYCGDKETKSEIRAGDFKGKYGFEINDTINSVKDISDNPERTMLFFITGDCHFLIMAENIKNTAYLSEENIFLISFLIELILNAHYSVKGSVKAMREELEYGSFSGHRIKTTLSSIWTAVDMLMSKDMSEDDQAQLKKLAYRGVAELTEIVNRVSDSARLKKEE